MNVETIDRTIVKPDFIERLLLKQMKFSSNDGFLRVDVEIEDPCGGILDNPMNFHILNSWFKYNNMTMIYWDFMTSIDTGRSPTFVGSFLVECYDSETNFKKQLGF